MSIWELDFYSRPILDEEGKKVWEVLICQAPTQVTEDPDRLFRYSQFCSSQQVNSLFLREAIEKAMAEAGETPRCIRFARRQMNNMITKACEDAGIAPAPSRRTYALDAWLAQREREIYPQETGYDAKLANAPSVQYPPTNPIALPDAVRGDRGDRWAFVNLTAADLADWGEWAIDFGEAFPPPMVGLTGTEAIPGVIVFSERALPLAAWMSGLELGYVRVEGGNRPALVLETGMSDSWILAPLANGALVQEAQQWQAIKEKAQGLHFLAIQSSPEAQDFKGFWLLKG